MTTALEAHSPVAARLVYQDVQTGNFIGSLGFELFPVSEETAEPLRQHSLLHWAPYDFGHEKEFVSHMAQIASTSVPNYGGPQFVSLLAFQGLEKITEFASYQLTLLACPFGSMNVPCATNVRTCTGLCDIFHQLVDPFSP